MAADVASLRPATRADVGLLLAFIHELGDFERLAHEVVVDEAVLADSLFGARPAAEAVIAEVDGAPAGFALFFHNFSTFHGRRGLYLEDLYVSPEARGLGAGKALLRHLAQLAVARDCGRFEWSVLDWNTPAIDFYQSFGARPQSEWTTYRLTGQALLDFAAGS